jgi:hypothetical protein
MGRGKTRVKFSEADLVATASFSKDIGDQSKPL